MQKRTKQSHSENPSKSYSNTTELVKKSILGVGITDASQNIILEFLIKSLQKPSKPYYVVTPNPEMIVLAHKNPEFRSVLNYAKIASNDGIGIGLAAKVLGMSLHERFTGVDLMENLCEGVSDWPITVGFLGGGSGVAELTAECLKKLYPKLNIVFADDHWFGEESKFKKEELRNRNQELNKKDMNKKTIILNSKFLIPKIDILFVAFGAPKQEFWMADRVGKIPVKVMIGVGGAFDYISRKVPRAPRLVRKIGMEWLFRLLIQPWRIKRQLALVEFAGMVIREKFHLSS